MRIPLAFLALCLGAWVLSADDSTPKPAHKPPVPIKIIGPGSSPEQLWGQTYFPPLMSFRVRSGSPPASGTAILCDIVTEKKPGQPGHTISIIALHCEGGLTMELDGIDLTGGGQQ